MENQIVCFTSNTVTQSYWSKHGYTWKSSSISQVQSPAHVLLFSRCVSEALFTELQHDMTTGAAKVE